MKKQIALLTVVASLAFAGDKQDESKVPKAVLDVVAKKFPNSAKKTFEKDGANYEVELETKKDGKTLRHSMDVSAEGTVLSESEDIAFDELPDAVKKAFQASAHGKSKVVRVERETEKGKTKYEIVLSAATKKVELTYDSAGTLEDEED